MDVKNFEIGVKTQGFCDIHDITDRARDHLAETEIREGQVTFFVSGSTAGLTTVEYEPGLIQDLKEFYERLIPQNAHYHHEETWHDGNGFSHVRSSLLKTSLTVPVVGHQFTLGTWQQIILIDFDNRPRSRQVVMQVMGVS